MSNQAPPDRSPNREDVMPDSYAVHVDDRHVHVWQYRVNVSEPEGEWYFVETLDRQDDLRLTLEYARPMAPEADGYWIYSQSYDCTLECE